MKLEYVGYTAMTVSIITAAYSCIGYVADFPYVTEAAVFTSFAIMLTVTVASIEDKRASPVVTGTDETVEGTVVLEGKVTSYGDVPVTFDAWEPGEYKLVRVDEQS